jgi:hypothetical protein
MTAFESRNRPAATDTVEPARDGRLHPGGEEAASVMSGGLRGMIRRIPTPYGWVGLLILATAVVNVFTAIQRTALNSPYELGRPILEESTSALVLIALLPLLKRSVDALSSTRDRRLGFIVVALAIAAYALLHIVLLVGLRQLIFPVFGSGYNFHWEVEFPQEFRKDVISAFMIAVVFWLIDRKQDAEVVGTGMLPAAAASDSENRRVEIWLKDGSSSIRVDPAEIISINSAGNYVEFALSSKRHLIRGTLASEEIRLKPFGFSRVHRTRLVNANRIAMIELRANGDFVLQMDNGETIVGSRRYRETIVAIKAGNRKGK